MNRLLLLSVAVAVVLSVTSPALSLTTEERLVERINARGGPWVASVAAHTAAHAHTAPQGSEHVMQLPRRSFSQRELALLPDTFDAREQWPQCGTIADVRDEANCISSWAVAAASAMSDRLCTQKKIRNVRLSAEDGLECGNGSCDGGRPEKMLSYMHSSGLVTEDCLPYFLPSCDKWFVDENSSNICDSQASAPQCKNTCSSLKIQWKEDKHYSTEPYMIEGEDNIRAEIYYNGPATATFMMYGDILFYKSGVYTSEMQGPMGMQSLKLFGWGTDDKTGLKYWLAANSWNRKWGENGLVRFVRGRNECGIEGRVVAAYVL